MFCNEPSRTLVSTISTALIAALIMGCASEPYTTERDKTAKGAGIGAAAGAAIAILKGKREADDILAGAAIGAGIGAGIGSYMDRQEERLARIPGTSVERVGKDTLLMGFKSDVLFAVDSAVIDPAGRSSLEQVANVMSEFDKTAVIVQGHTDATGNEQHNQALSERRAVSVKNYLIGRGVDATRLAAVGYGEGYPVASNTTPQGRQLNRRVDILLKVKAR
jgi:outer membrane protein OmpA-like peptidoglycan-associated protein